MTELHAFLYSFILISLRFLRLFSSFVAWAVIFVLRCSGSLYDVHMYYYFGVV
jgi:hypothetical protein